MELKSNMKLFNPIILDPDVHTNYDYYDYYHRDFCLDLVNLLDNFLCTNLDYEITFN